VLEVPRCVAPMHVHASAVPCPVLYTSSVLWVQIAIRMAHTGLCIMPCPASVHPDLAQRSFEAARAKLSLSFHLTRMQLSPYLGSCELHV